MSKINRFEDLKIWQEATEIGIKIFKITNDELKKDFALKGQLERAAISVSSNIAEGFEYNNTRNFVRFLYYSKASCGELRSQLYMGFKLELIKEENYLELYDALMALSKRISAFIKYLKNFERNKTENTANANLSTL
ncbi:MAG: four helix bundle protein [Cytophagaceae bacterium]|nr:four helix bundle protein [Cytophagaceae bacterium]